MRTGRAKNAAQKPLAYLGKSEGIPEPVMPIGNAYKTQETDHIPATNSRFLVVLLVEEHVIIDYKTTQGVEARRSHRLHKY